MQEPETYGDMLNTLHNNGVRIESLQNTIKELQIERRVLLQLVKFAIHKED